MKRAIRDIFRPGKPVIDRKLLVGRTRQLNRILDLLESGGRTVVITGARGIGKTSLANVSAGELGGQVETQCHSATTFSSWALDLLSNYGEKTNLSEKTIERTLGSSFGTEVLAVIGLKASRKSIQKEKGIADIEITPDVLYRLLHKIGSSDVITVDEFDRVPRSDEKTISLFGDLIKLLGDRSGKHRIKVVFIGVSSSAQRLFQNHESIKRNITAIHLRRLAQKAIGEFFSHISELIELQFAEDVIESFKKDFRGFPHFVHLVGEFCAANCSEESIVSMKVYETAVDQAIDELLGIDSRWDFIRNKSTPEGDAVLMEVIASGSLRVREADMLRKLQRVRFSEGKLRSTIGEFVRNRMLKRRGSDLALTDPEMSPFLHANFRKRRYVSSRQIPLPF